MKFDHAVKYNGKYYKANVEIPEEAAPEQVLTAPEAAAPVQEAKTKGKTPKEK